MSHIWQPLSQSLNAHDRSTSGTSLNWRLTFSQTAPLPLLGVLTGYCTAQHGFQELWNNTQSVVCRLYDDGLLNHKQQRTSICSIVSMHCISVHKSIYTPKTMRNWAWSLVILAFMCAKTVWRRRERESELSRGYGKEAKLGSAKGVGGTYLFIHIYLPAFNTDTTSFLLLFVL